MVDLAEDAEKSIAVVPMQKALVTSKIYGKGKIIQRKAGSGKIMLPPAKRAQDLLPEEVVRYSRWLEQGETPLLDLNSLEDRKQAWQLLRSCSPAHLRNTGLLSDEGQAMHLQKLEQLAGDTETEFLACMDKSNCFRVCNDANNAFGSDYCVREPTCVSMPAKFRDFCRYLKQWRSKSVLLQMPIRELRQLEDDRPFQLCQAVNCSDALHENVLGCVQWEWLEDLQRRHRMGTITHVDLEIGGRNALLPAQYSTQDRLLLQITGSRRILVIDPKHSFDGMYPYPVHHPYDSYSMVDWEQPDPDEWPLCQHVRGLVCILQPGDVLLLPACWWAHQQLCSDENVALSFSLSLGHRVRPESAMRLRVSRLVEDILGDLDGPARILYWLDVLEREAEDEVIDEWTVEGYEQTQAVWDAREEVEFVLGKGTWKNLFPAMSEGRLRPTPWLNKNFREPLFLMDKPTRIPDTRTDEQRRYPELFQHAQ